MNDTTTQATEGFTTIEEALEIVKQLGVSAPEPELLCWISHDDKGEHHANYCRPCAGKIANWLLGGDKPEGITEHQEHPTWQNCTEEKLNINNGGYGYETEGCEHCQLCGAHLSVTLLKYGVESELEHFEEVADGDFTPDDWRHIEDLLNGIQHVESDWFPLPHLNPYEVEEWWEFHKRVLALVNLKAKVNQ